MPFSISPNCLKRTVRPYRGTRGGQDVPLRRLDCAVIRFLHKEREDAGYEPFDTVRPAFVEGEPLYAGSGFAAKNHIQICVRNTACIKGYFRPLNAKGRPLAY